MTTRAARLLGRPIEINGVTLPNRVVMAPMTRAQCPDGVPTREFADYYARRAAGGTGLVITEASYIDHSSAGQHGSVSRFYGAEALAGWERVVDAVHAERGHIFAQLQHVGMARNPGEPPVRDAVPFGPSGIPLFPGASDGHVMTEADIEEIVTAFADAADRAEALGFDGIELHGAHGYLIDQFFWDQTNQRTDRFGGSLLARAEFAKEVVARVRGRVSPSFPVMLRMSQWKANDFAARIAESPEDLQVILDVLVAAGVDAFHASTRRYWEPEFDGSDLNFAGWIKKLSGKPTISVGSVGLDTDFTTTMGGSGAEIRGIEGLLDRLGRGEFDMIAVGRSLLADPAWATKVLGGRAGEVVPFTPEALVNLH